MAEKVKRLGLERDSQHYIYFIDREGSVWRAAKPRAAEDHPSASREVVVSHAITRDRHFLYFIDRDGDIARTPRLGRRRAA